MATPVVARVFLNRRNQSEMTARIVANRCAELADLSSLCFQNCSNETEHQISGKGKVGICYIHEWRSERLRVPVKSNSGKAHRISTKASYSRRDQGGNKEKGSRNYQMKRCDWLTQGTLNQTTAHIGAVDSTDKNQRGPVARC